MTIAVCAIAALLMSAFISDVPAQRIPLSKTTAKEATRVRGRVLAWKETFAFGAGLGPQYVVFVFGVEKGEAPLNPIKVAYAFFKSDGPPPDSFFDYSKRYELQAVRDPKCDESVNSLSYAKNVDESGKPSPPTYVLRFLPGAPKVVLKPDAILPCYVLRPGNYKLLAGRSFKPGVGLSEAVPTL